MILTGDALEILPTLDAESVQTCVTSPPYYGLRNYGVDGQIGLEATYLEYVETLVQVFREVRRALRPDGTLWLNLGDSYATGAGKVGDCPGGGPQGEAWKRHFGKNTRDMRTKGQTPPNRMPLEGLKPKDLIGIPWRVAFALQADGWYLRQDIIWHKPNPMPESVSDRCTKSHEYIFLLTKSAKYFYDAESVKEPAVEGFDLGILRSVKAADGQGPTDRHSIDKRLESGIDKRHGNPSGKRNRRSVWTITTKPFKEAHFATFPPELPEICIRAGSKIGDTILDPFSGAGTTGLVAEKLGRKYIGIELNPAYSEMGEKRIEAARLPLFP